MLKYLTCVISIFCTQASANYEVKCIGFYYSLDKIIRGGADSFFALKILESEITSWTGTIAEKRPSQYAETFLSTYYTTKADAQDGLESKWIWDFDCDSYAAELR